MAPRQRTEARAAHVAAPSTAPLTRISLRVASPKAPTPPTSGGMTLKIRPAAPPPSIRVTPPVRSKLERAAVSPSRAPLVVSLRPPAAPGKAPSTPPTLRRRGGPSPALAAPSAPSAIVIGPAAPPITAPAHGGENTGHAASNAGASVAIDVRPAAEPFVPFVEPVDAELESAESIVRRQLREYLDGFDRSDEPFPMDDTHILAAVSSRLPPYHMSTDETAVYPQYLLVETRYCEHRNRILALWFARPGSWLTRRQVLADVIPGDELMVEDIYGFLARGFYINFGVLPDPAPFGTADIWPGDAIRVLVVGAGVAGLAVTRALHQGGLQAVAFEARDRVGGRVHGVPMTSPRSDEGRGTVHGSRYMTDCLDLGASIVTGLGGGNPLAVLALQLGLGIHVIQAECPLHGVDGRVLPPELDQRAEALFNELMDEAALLRTAVHDQSLDEGLSRAWTKLTPPPTLDETRAVGWHIANLEFANATPLRALSLKQWDQDDGHEFSGDHTMIRGGYGQFASGLASGLDIQFSSPVTAVSYGPGWASVTLADGSVHTGNAVVVTASLGVLQRNLIRFDPPLPERKQTAIRRMGFGALNKVALVFDEPFWLQHENASDIFGCVQKSDRGLYFMFYNLTGILRRPSLVGLISGEAAYKVESWTKEKVVEGALETLRRAFPGRHVGEPVQSAVSRWGSDVAATGGSVAEYCFGSYSSIPPGAVGEDYDALAAPVGDSLFFAGEATNRYFPATVHGAYMSGVREASRILNIHHPLKVHATARPIASFAGSLQCRWADCTATLDAVEHLRDHVIAVHLARDRGVCLTGQNYYRAHAQQGRDYVKRGLAGTRPDDRREGSPAPPAVSGASSGRIGNLAGAGGGGGGGGGHGHARKRTAPAVSRRNEEVDPARVQELLPIELNTVKAINSSLRSYLLAKDIVLEHFKRHGPIRKRDARVIVKINVNHTSKFYDLWEKLGWITRPEG